jgi:hypothetical protein
MSLASGRGTRSAPRATRGHQGLLVSRGLPGHRGLLVSRGFRGIPAPRGLTGAQGTPGIQGNTGAQGPPGSDGTAGVTVTNTTANSNLRFLLTDIASGGTTTNLKSSAGPTYDPSSLELVNVGRFLSFGNIAASGDVSAAIFNGGGLPSRAQTMLPTRRLTY